MQDETKEGATEAAAALIQSMPPTEMIYYSYEGNFELECEAKIVGFHAKTTTAAADDDDYDGKTKGRENERKAATTTTTTKVEVFLDRSCMHAQGGGQPTDIGTISISCRQQQQPNNDNNNENQKEVVISVDKVVMDRETGVATHHGTATATTSSSSDNDHDNAMVLRLPVGTPVRVSVDADHRRLLSECHTAGHVVDSAMARCGKLMKPTKGYHFLDGPYVEYEGSIPAEERPRVLKDLQTAFRDLVQEDIPTKIELLPEDQANEICNRIAKNYFDMKDFGGGKEDGPSEIRVVTVASFPCPCGGTHVHSTGALKERKWGIIGIKSKKGVVRVRYGQDSY